ncbi:MAG: tetratricopeptide repeat protein [Bacteroidota bacterium]|nr:tetratricopeptide repeat protein [Bacteroidota bacterium]
MFANGSVKSFFIFFLLLFATSLVAQQTQVYVAPDAAYRNASDLFEKQKYAEAQDAFDKIVFTAKDKKDLLVIDAQYYAALCALELFHKDAEIRLKQFLADHPESPKCRKVKFQLGRYNYRKKSYKDAIAWFRQVEIYDLQKEELAEYYFKRGYSHYELGHADSAKIDFYEIKDIDAKYSPAATYYYAHISYTQGNYETALQGFQKLSGNETFGPVVPYYIAQIYFWQSRYAEVISYAPPLLDSAKRAPEIAHLIGASYYRTGRYKNAIPFLEKYQKGANNYTRDDAYELGYAYYKSDSCKYAMEYFQQAIADSSDAIAQNSWYHLADCYLKSGDKLQARNAFVKASQMKFDPVIREDALFNSARLSYELDFDPFNEAIVSLNEYLKEFPNTPRHDEAYTLLTNVYLSTKNYKEALASIEKLKTINPLMQPTYQKVAYNRGIELHNQGDYNGAVVMFDKALIYPISRELNSQSHYWKAESWYAKAEKTKADSLYYMKAIAEYQQFQVTPGATILPNYNTANYNIGYCYFQQKQWSSSMVAFRKYLANKSASDASVKVFDANLRLGDGYLRMGDYLNSTEFYGKALEVQKPDNSMKDYAMYQQAMAYGYLGKKKEKADLLRQMRETYPGSNFLATSRIEEARTLHDLGMYDQALEAFRNLYNANPTGPMAFESLQKMGLIYRSKNDPDNAMVQYKKAVELVKGKGTDDFKNLMVAIKELYIDKNQLDQWEAYATSVGYSESQSVADSTAYVVAVKFFSEGKCPDVIAQTNKYIQKFPMGLYITEVHFMRAECAFKANDLVTALGSYNAVLDKGRTKHTERALAQTSLIYYKQDDYVNAARMFGRLERESQNGEVQNNARVNLMRSYLFLNNYDSAAIYAAKVIAIQNLSNEIYGQAHYLLGKAAMAKGDRVEAEKRFKAAEKAVPNTEYAAESRYNLCLIKYQNKDYKATEKALLSQINDYAGYPTWSGKGWLLLADNYLALKDTFQAKYVLQNYIENGDVKELIQQAKDKLMVIEAAQQGGKMRKSEDLIIPLGNPEEKDFENEPNQGGGQ